ncbi:GNAT family N-acetyltransferase [Alteromonas gilva]|uniref:GNAT family N-acetyltransferase n=1 Tax=Alteromonas gilva TaxID=2987522 RepID=A0ABT5L2R8_9ALTE|nr:GNAT family N-acetyltransferase [Alteromonas gilva]MDC8831331.1 GNAT family N-acetyltransferase [Alteromonas gilva]
MTANIHPRSLALVTPDIAYKTSYEHYIKELGNEERYPFPMDFDHRDFPAMLQRIADFKAGINLPAGYVPSSTFWLVSSDELIGVVNIRHYLNEALREAGGHIGLGIRPSARGQSLGVYLLQQGILQAGALGVDVVHVHCYKNNLASANMILRCGGVLHSEYTEHDPVVQRYLITQTDN